MIYNLGWRYALDQKVEIIKVVGTRSFLPLPMIEFGYYFFFVCKAQAIIYILYILSTQSLDTARAVLT